SSTHLRWLEGKAAARGGLAKVAEGAKAEEEIYTRLGLPYPAPELREGPTPTLPDVLPSVGGIFHVHTEWSDGCASIAEMAREAESAGFAYIGISDHSRAASYANGLDDARLQRQSEDIERARRQVPGITILHGVEVDILPDGALDLDDETLRRLDF